MTEDELREEVTNLIRSGMKSVERLEATRPKFITRSDSFAMYVAKASSLTLPEVKDFVDWLAGVPRSKSR